jgi:TRAP-type C4-dicarboxylate transport system substrate-binding protein
MDSPTFVSMFNHLDALPTVTSMGELFTALQQGAVDGQENPLTSIARRKFNEVQNYLMMTYHSYAPVVLVANKSFWDGLPEDVQAVFREAAAEATQFERDAAEQEEITWKEELKKDMTVIDLTDEEIAQWQQAMEPVFAEFKPTIGEDIYRIFGLD